MSGKENSSVNTQFTSIIHKLYHKQHYTAYYSASGYEKHTQASKINDNLPSTHRFSPVSSKKATPKTQHAIF